MPTGKKSTVKKAVARLIGKATAKRTTAKPAPAKSSAKPAAKSAAKKAVAKPAAKKTVAKPAAKKTVAKPAAKKTVAKPAAKKTATKPAAKPAAKKTVAKPAAKPAAKKTVAKPAAKPAAKKPEAKPAAKKTVAETPAKKAAVKPEDKPATPVVAVDPENKPKAPRRRAPLDPADIPEPTPLAHQAAISVPKAFVQPDSIPREKKRERDDETIWTAAELKAMRKIFDADLVQREHALNEAVRILDSLNNDSDEGAGGETADTGNAILEREEQLSRVSDAQSKYEQTKAAIERLDNKRYAFCEDCGKPIGKLRLKEGNPYATLCISCKEAADRPY